ncbi:MAG: SHOCT domain-containing protein [Planctomycetes bacterium]|nr:SHOCT domain-containing protein [Planctomycetota bacterium]
MNSSTFAGVVVVGITSLLLTFLVGCRSGQVRDDRESRAIATDISVPAGFPALGAVGDSITLGPTRVVNFSDAAAEANKDANPEKEPWQRFLYVSNRPGEGARGGEYPAYGWNRVRFSLAELPAGREIKRAELWLARADHEGELGAVIAAQDVNMVFKHSPRFWHADNWIPVSEPSQLMLHAVLLAEDKKRFTIDPEDHGDITADEYKKRNPFLDGLALETRGEADILDITELVRGSIKRTDYDFILEFHFSVNGKIFDPMFDGMDKACAVAWSRRGESAPRLRITMTAAEAHAGSIDDELEELRKMKERGLLTEDEYLEQKAALLKKGTGK